MSEQGKKPDDAAAAAEPEADAAPVAEPELETNPEELEFSEPKLEQAQIGNDAAREAELDVVAAETEAAAKEAEVAGQQLGRGRSTDVPVTAAGTAPVGAAAGDTAAASGEETDAGLSLEAASPQPQWAPEATDDKQWDRIFDAVQISAVAQQPDGGTPAPEETATDAGSPAPAEGDPEPQPGAATPPPAEDPGTVPPSEWTPAPGNSDGETPPNTWYSVGQPPAGKKPAAAAGATDRPRGKALLFIGLGIVAAIVIIVVIIISLLNRSGEPTGTAASSSPAVAKESPGADGIIAEDVSPFDFEEGQCFIDFEAATQNATVVSCETPHAAQLVGTYFYEEADEFPGKDELNVQAEEFCSAIELNDNADEYENLRNSYGMPSEGTWQEGDRRIDCFVISDEGNNISASLIGE
ncbi:septum formation family protein [Crystallibacter degradans]|uniref:septum formation family protein n=1 Tax=Crystallibacter degradans TaxID=2726743 RepID=UPI0014764DE4|nr:septum formation family protein [Arthrobacter sp. SF27]NMR29693.1 hypothetical protein [Arthrobacter sp. SF27]